MTFSFKKETNVAPIKKAKKITRTYKTLEPVYMSKLNEMIGATKLAEIIGCQSNTIYSAMRSNSVSFCYEKLCEHEYKKRMSAGSGMTPVLAFVPENLVNELNEQLAQVGGSAVAMRTQD